MFDPVEAVKNYVRHPSVSTDPSFHDGMDGARRFVSDLIGSIGFGVETIETSRHPIVLAHREGRRDFPHVVIYGHYDVQPADPLELWTSPPFEPEVRDGCLYGRGVADNKGPQMVHIAAIARILEKDPDFPLRVTFLLEGEEEIGSPSFGRFLDNHQDLLAGDFTLLSDTMSPSSDRIAITTGLRGLVCLEVELTGPGSDLHSGVHGGAVRNPLQALAGICASLHDHDGRVNLPGFYDNVEAPGEWDREQLRKVELSTEDYAELLGVRTFHTVGGVPPMEATRFWPTLEFNGMGGGYQGEGSKTIIPSKAFVKISCRLVPTQVPAEIEALLVDTLKSRCPEGVEMEIKIGQAGAPYGVTPPAGVPVASGEPSVIDEAFTCAETAISEVFGHAPIYLREGGSIPIIPDLKRVCGMDSLMIGMFTPESNLHAPNENFHLGMFAKGIDVSERVLRGVSARGARGF